MSAGGLDLEVVPRGASSLEPGERTTLDTNLGTMLQHALADPLRLDVATAAQPGSRFERAAEALCDLVARARRERVIRQYRVREELTGSAKGQLRFPAQALVAPTRPGLFASRWVELDEHTPENRLLKASLAFCRTRRRPAAPAGRRHPGDVPVHRGGAQSSPGLRADPLGATLAELHRSDRAGARSSRGQGGRPLVGKPRRPLRGAVHAGPVPALRRPPAAVLRRSARAGRALRAGRQVPGPVGAWRVRAPEPGRAAARCRAESARHLGAALDPRREVERSCGRPPPASASPPRTSTRSSPTARGSAARPPP